MVVNIAGDEGRRYWWPTSEPAKHKPVDIDTKNIERKHLDSQDENGLNYWSSASSAKPDPRELKVN